MGSCYNKQQKTSEIIVSKLKEVPKETSTIANIKNEKKSEKKKYFSIVIILNPSI